MYSILAGYFEVIDSEALVWLRVLVLFPFGLIRCAALALAARTRRLRFQLAALLIAFVLWMLPSRSTIREQLWALMRDLSLYRRYSGWCELDGVRRLPFDNWHAERLWVFSKMRRMVANGE